MSVRDNIPLGKYNPAYEKPTGPMGSPERKAIHKKNHNARGTSRCWTCWLDLRP